MNSACDLSARLRVIRGQLAPNIPVLSAVVLVITMAGRDPTPLNADESATRAVVVTDAAGKVRTGTLNELAGGQLTLGLLDHVWLKTKNLVSMKVKERTSALAPGPLVILAGGDVLAVRPESIDDEWLTGRWTHFASWPAVKLPLETVRAVLFERPRDPAASARLLSRVLEYDDSQDAVILTNGDTLAGELSGLDDKRLLLTTSLGKSGIDRSGIRAVIFNPSLTSSESLKGEGALVSLVDGSRFRVRDMKFGSLDRLLVHTLFGVELDFPLTGLESLRFLGGCATYLSDLTPAEYRFEPYLALDWPLRRDRSVAGGFLTLRGTEYPKGLGVHSRSSVSYRLDGKYRWFRATVGIDDDAAGKGSVTFEVLADSRSIYKSDVLTGTSPAVTLDRLDVSGAKLLTLRVDYATQGDIQDHADWCDAVLIK